jgi:hypothetical protein
MILLWDIHCKDNFLKYLNNNNKYNCNKNINVSVIGSVIQINDNYIYLMDKHPQEFDNINILIDEIINTINKNNLNKIISFSTAGSQKYNIGSVLQFCSAKIENHNKYSLNFNYVKSNYIFCKTDKFVNEPIIDTKGFINPTINQAASGEDEFLIYIISNKIKIPCLTLTGISDNNNSQQYDNGGGNLAGKNIVDYFFSIFTYNIHLMFEKINVYYI